MSISTPPGPDKILFTGRRFFAKTQDGRDVIAQELEESNYYYLLYFASNKKKGDKNIVHKNSLRHLKEMKVKHGRKNTEA